jgi:hypothetical protein
LLELFALSVERDVLDPYFLEFGREGTNIGIVLLDLLEILEVDCLGLVSMYFIGIVLLFSLVFIVP